MRISLLAARCINKLRYYISGSFLFLSLPVYADELSGTLSSSFAAIKTIFQQNYFTLIALELCLLVFCYYFLICFRARSQLNDFVLSVSEPHMAVSPSMARFIMQNQFDCKALTAAIVSMAIKGVLNIENKNGILTLVLKENIARQYGLPVLTNNLQKNLRSSEKSAFNMLFSQQNTVTFKNHTVWDNARIALQSDLLHDAETGGLYPPFKYSIFGFILSLLPLAAVAAQYVNSLNTFTLLFMLFSILITLCNFFLYRLDIPYVGFAHWLMPTAFSIKLLFDIERIWHTLVMVLAGSCAVLACIMGVFLAPPSITLIYCLVAAINIFFYCGWRRFIRKAILDQLQSSKLLLANANRNQASQSGSIALTAEIFEKYLPYAIALDIEQEWGDQFNHLSNSPNQDGTHFHPTWYVGNIKPGTTTGIFAKELSQNITSCIAAIFPSNIAS